MAAGNASGVSSRTPAQDGFSMPAEWSPHAGCFISWPSRELTWRGHFEDAKKDYSAVMKAVDRFEPVTVVADPRAAKEARRMLGPGMSIFEARLDDSWVRDNGPIFVRRDDDRLALVNFRFNGWGRKAPYEVDDRLPTLMAERLRIRGVTMRPWSSREAR